MYSPLGHRFENAIRQRRPDVTVFHLYNDGVGSADPSDVLAAVKDANEVVVAAFVTHLPGGR